MNTAPARFGPVIVSTQARAADAHAPVQRASFQPGAGLAASPTRFPFGTILEQLFGQAMPRGTLVTVPWPVTATVSFTSGVAAAESPTAPRARIDTTSVTAIVLARTRRSYEPAVTMSRARSRTVRSRRSGHRRTIRAMTTEGGPG